MIQNKNNISKWTQIIKFFDTIFKKTLYICTNLYKNC